MLDANVCKFNCMSLAYEFMRLVRRENNSDKETFINIPYISWSHWLSQYNPSYPRSAKLSSTIKTEINLKFFIIGRAIELMTMWDWYVEGVIQTRKPL